jgi:hypothetical protein
LSALEPTKLLPFLHERKLTNELDQCSAWRIIRVTFGSGVNLKELTSIAEIMCLLSGLRRPSRDTRRSFPALVQWYEVNWGQISPFLPIVQLRDSQGAVIDAKRELCDRYAT